jgi:Ca2+-binding RTX toxin-like protein
VRLYHNVQRLSWPSSPTEIVDGVYGFNSGQFVRTNGTVGTYQDVAFQMNKSYGDVVYNDTTSTVVNFGSAQGLVWKGSASQIASVDLQLGFSWNGYSNFVDLVGGAANDYLAGSDGRNNIIGGAGTDQLYGRGGDDFISADYNDLVFGVVDGELATIL